MSSARPVCEPVGQQGCHDDFMSSSERSGEHFLSTAFFTVNQPRFSDIDPVTLFAGDQSSKASIAALSVLT